MIITPAIPRFHGPSHRSCVMPAPRWTPWILLGSACHASPA